MYYCGVVARASRVLTEVSSACLVAVSIVVACLRCGRVVGFAGFVLYGCLQRQFHRLVEMLILKHMDPADERANRAYRLQVKERLYRFNFVSPTLHVLVSDILITWPSTPRRRC